MTRSERKWFYRTALLLGGVACVALLLPGQKPGTSGVVVAPSKAEIHLAALVAPPKFAVDPVAAAMTEPVAHGENLNAPTTARSDSAAAGWSAYATPAIPQAATPPLAALPANLQDGRVAGTGVNVRSGPSSSAGKVFVLAAGEAVKVGESSGGWTHVFRPSGESGWVYSRYLAGTAGADQVASAAPPQRQSAPPQDTAQADDPPGRYARLGAAMAARSAPDSYAAPVFLIDAGERVRIANSHGRWIKVVTADGSAGWIPT